MEPHQVIDERLTVNNDRATTFWEQEPPIFYCETSLRPHVDLKMGLASLKAFNKQNHSSQAFEPSETRETDAAL